MGTVGTGHQRLRYLSKEPSIAPRAPEPGSEREKERSRDIFEKFEARPAGRARPGRSENLKISKNIGISQEFLKADYDGG